MSKKTAAFALPEWLDAQQWTEFLAHRKTLKKPMTEYAQKLAVKVLEKFRAAGHDPKASIDQSILNGWQGLFEPRSEAVARVTNKQEVLESRNREVGRRWAERTTQEDGDAVH